MTQARIGIPVPVVYGGIAAIIGLLLAVGFFAGRASSENGGGGVPGTMVAEPAFARSASEGSGAPAAHTAGGVLAPIADPAVTDSRGGALGSAAGTSPEATVLTASSPALAGAGGAMPQPTLGRDVAEYFRRMDATQSAAKTWSDPTALAQEVLAQALRGDSGGFDKLIVASAAARDGVRTILVPAPCAEHHRLTLELLDEAVVILTRLREGVAAGDPSAIAGIASSGSALEARARGVDQLGASLRSQFGVAAAQ